MPPGLRRSRNDRVVAGVAGGLGRWLGVDPVLVRLAFIVLTLAAGFGLVAYLVCRLVIPEADADPPARTPTKRGAVALALVTAGLLSLLRGAGWWTSDAVVWPLAWAAIGSGLVWTRGSAHERARWLRFAGRLGGTAEPAADVDLRPDRGATTAMRVARGLVGGGLVLGGMAALLAANDAFASLRDLLAAATVVTVGAGLLLGPWILRLVRQLGDERRERIRSEERAEMAAHLHDSVLQTLALIQRAPDQAEAVRLARGQERELRAWLFDKPSDLAGRRLVAAIEAAAAHIDDRYGVPIEVVAVGDADLDDQLRALVGAAAEAMANAARHSGAPMVTVYVEVDATQVVVFVRDEGRGFVAAAVPPDRRGLAESIHGRMARHGGTATIDSTPGEGTEIELRVPRRTVPEEAT